MGDEDKEMCKYAIMQVCKCANVQMREQLQITNGKLKMNAIVRLIDCIISINSITTISGSDKNLR